uniref:Cellular inhibitor of PP2A n=1 Tax=Tetraodon nigroviridis TaxID=99883 RepID=H3CIG6_TETNG
MDTSTCFKSLWLAIQQYREGRSRQNAAQLQRQVEEFPALRFGQLLSSGQVLASECMNGLLELAAEPNTSPALTGAIVSLLAQLACDEASCEALHRSYSCTSTLASVVHQHCSSPAEPLVLQCLQVLQKLTYNTGVFQSTNHIQELVTFLVTNIQADNDELLLPCLGLMANLCRDNRSVQSRIKSLADVKPFYRTLVDFLTHNSLTVVVFTLSILASLALNEKVGQKLFGRENIHQTFQLVFNMIVNGGGTTTAKCCVDLLVDLLKNPKIADYLSRYPHFTACVSQVLGLLQLKDPESAAKVLELLLAMCAVPALRALLCEVVFRPAGPKLKVAGCGQGPAPDVGCSGDAGLALVQWLGSPVDGAESCSLQTLQLLTELLEEALGPETVSDCVLSFTQMLLPVLLGFPKSIDPAQGDAHLRKQCRRIAGVSSLLLHILSALTLSLLCAVDATRSLVSQEVSAQFCLSQAGSLLSCCHSNSNELSQLMSEALLKTLELMSKLRLHVKDMETSFYSMLQDQRMVTPLSLALTSHHRELVQRGLSLLQEATPLPHFPLLLLGGSIAANNAYRQREAELPGPRAAAQEAPAPAMLDSSDSSRSVHCLGEKLQNTLELQEHVKDSRVSEIIAVYEQKLWTFTAKETGLQDLLEAKAKALSQADRLMEQYRLQQARAEAEACKLGSLLKEAERRGEDLQTELNSQVLEAERAKADMKELFQHNSRLQRDSEEHQVLRGAYNTLLSRFNNSERVLKDLQAAHLSLSKQNDCLRKNHETLQLQHERMVEEREKELECLHSDLQQKNDDITGLRGELQAEEEKVKEKERERKDLEETVDLLRMELNKMEEARKEASIKASSLELQKSQLEQRLKQKEDELNKQSSLICRIHSLSSG